MFDNPRFPALIVILLLAAGLAGGNGASIQAMAGLDGPDPEAGLPFIRNYSSKEYRASAQNWTIIQDRRGVIYAGNNDGILEYDGTGWRLIPTLNQTVVRSLAVDGNGRIWAGTQGEMGYLAPDETGKLRFVSLTSQIEASCRDFSDIWDIYATPRGVYFQSRECLFLMAGGRIQSWKAETGFHGLFYVRDRLFIRQINRGLLELVEGKLVMVPGGERFAREKIYAMLPLDRPVTGEKPDRTGSILIGTQQEGFYVFDGISIRPFPTRADAFLRANLLYRCLVLKDGSIAAATLQGGLLLLGRNFEPSGILNKATGLANDTVYSIHDGGRDGLWLAHDQGISRVEWPSPLTLLDERSGLKGNVLSLHRHQGRLYAGTSQGAYVLTPEDTGSSTRPTGCRFQPVAGINSHCWDFVSSGGSLLAATYLGIFEILGSAAVPVHAFSTWPGILHVSKSDPARVWVGLQDGLASIIRRGEGKNPWVNEGKIPGISERVRTVMEAADGSVWLGTQSPDLIRITFSRNRNESGAATAPAVEHLGTGRGLPAGPFNDVYSVGGEPAVATRQGLFRLDRATERFVLDQRLASLFPEGPRWTEVLQEDRQGRIWLDSIDYARNLHETGVAILQSGGTFRWEKTPFLRFASMTIWCIQADDDGIVWFGGPEGLIRFNPRISKDYLPACPALIRRVEKGTGQLLHAGAPPATGTTKVPGLEYTGNSLHFEFTLPACDLPEANRYQVRLEGLDQDWSPWTAQTMKEYTNLPEGPYNFRVKARNVYGMESQEGNFRVVVFPPWYRTWPAYLGFALAGLGLLAGGVRTYTYGLHREKERLEKLVVQRTRELKEASLTDPLTGLRNRRYINEILNTEVSAFLNYKEYLLHAKDRRNLYEQSRQVFGILLFDIDHFKMVNDSYGHDAGDKVLMQLARILQSSVRFDDAVMRTGGEEFLIVLKKTVPEYLEILAGKIMDKIRQHDFLLTGETVLKRTCSIGYSTFPFYERHPGLLSFEQTIMLADLGLYYAKQHGRNLAAGIVPGDVPPGGAEVQKMVVSLDFALQRNFFTIKT